MNNDQNNSIRQTNLTNSIQTPDPTSVSDIDNITNQNTATPSPNNIYVLNITQLAAMFAQRTESTTNQR